VLQRDTQADAESPGFNHDGVTNTVTLNYSSAAATQSDAGNTLEIMVSVKDQTLFLPLVYTEWLEVTARANAPCASG